MSRIAFLCAAAVAATLGAGSASAACIQQGGRTYCEVTQATTVVTTRRSRYAQKPGCCANAPVPTAQYGTRRYIYPDGRVVVVYSAGRGLGHQPFQWAVPPQ